MNGLNIFCWVIFPYLMLGSFIFGTILRFTKFKGSVTAKSSELLEKCQLIIGSILFHVGIIFVFAGHVMGVLVPKAVTDFFGISDELYHGFALLMGGIFGIMAFAGILILTYRRFSSLKVFVTSSWSDLIVDVALLITIILGLSASFIAGPNAPDFNYRETLAVWARQLFYFAPNYHLMAQVPLLFKIHVLCGLTIFGIFPYTRLVHALTVPLQYTFRRLIVYRANNKKSAW